MGFVTRTSIFVFNCNKHVLYIDCIYALQRFSGWLQTTYFELGNICQLFNARDPVAPVYQARTGIALAKRPYIFSFLIPNTNVKVNIPLICKLHRDANVYYCFISSDHVMISHGPIWSHSIKRTIAQNIVVVVVLLSGLRVAD